MSNNQVPPIVVNMYVMDPLMMEAVNPPKREDYNNDKSFQNKMEFFEKCMDQRRQFCIDVSHDLSESWQKLGLAPYSACCGGEGGNVLFVLSKKVEQKRGPGLVVPV